MAEGQSGAFGTQFAYLLFLVLRLKSWKFLLWILLGPSLFFNFFLYRNIEDKEEGGVKSNGLTELKMSVAMAHGALVPTSSREKKSLIEIMQLRKAKSRSWFKDCKDINDCRIQLAKAVSARSSEKTSIFIYGKNKTIRLYCLKDKNAEILCPFLYHAMSQSLESYEYARTKSSKAQTALYKDIMFAKFFDKFGSSSDSVGLNISKPDSMCTRTSKSGTFFIKFIMYFMGHMIIVLASFILYTTVGSLSSMSNLKENGFLQLVFNNGLSVTVYWLVYWTIGAIEALIPATLLVMSYSFQCPGYYESSGLTNFFITVAAMFFFLTALGYLFATLIASFFIVLLLMIVIQIVCCGVIIMAKLWIFQKKPLSTINTFLAFPPGCIVEYGTKYLLPKEAPFHKYFKPYGSFFDSIQINMIVFAILIIITTIYLDFVVKNGNGLCLPFMYPFNPSFWNPHRQKLIEMVDEQPKRANVEPTVGVPAVIADDIHLTYPSGCCEAKKPPVLKGITCTVYQGQITALIGHNGAGKTTLIRVLMGEEIPSRGVAVINGHRVTDPYQRLALRGSVSICKQVDVLSNYLTVMESMKLTLVAKGFSPDSQVAKVLDMMKRLGLAGKENVQAMDLSGGQMRKVCSIICLLGNPKLVILDEPTSGLDPVSRRNLWQILQDHKAGRSIILCTQFMDEADILADRKVFLSAGKIICAGSSMFLKNAFGCCVSINVSLKSIEFARPLVKCLKKVKLVSQMHTELLLNVSADKPQFLADAIQVLEEHKEWVEAFGVSQAQLDTIFMRLRHIDLENIEASFRSKKLRKAGRAERAEAAVVPVNYDALYNFESKSPILATQRQQFCTLLAMNFNRQKKFGVKFSLRFLFPIILVIVVASMVDSERTEEVDAQQAAIGGKTSKAMVRTLVQDFHPITQFGICVFNSDKNDASATDLVTKECNAMFDVTEPEANQVKVIPKSPSVTMKDFLKQADVLQTIRKLCRISFCFILHSSSWNRNDSNRVREVHIGQYTVPPDVDIPNAAAISVGHMLTIYLKFSKHFKAVPRSNAPNLTIKRAYTFDTFESFEFTKSYELLMFITAFSIVPITYLNDPIEDRDCGVRQQLRSMGMRSLAYWLNNFILHWTHYMIYFLLSAAACMVWDRYQSQFFFVNVCLPVLIFGTASCLLSVYVVSALMKKSNPVVIVSCFFFALFLGVVANIAQNSSTAMLILICFLPQFTPVAYILLSVKLMIYSLYFLELKNPDNVLNLANLHLSNSNILVSLIAMPVHCVLLVLLLILAENPAGIKLAFKKPDLEKDSELEKTIKDTGVPLEAERINKTPRNPLNMLEVRDLQKVYPNGVHAVRGTTFGSFSGEILGLLGPNGAGKTTSMSIIVGEEASSSGTSEVHFGGTWMSGIDGARCGAIGYCPQHNPLFNSISVFEHLRFYAQIRGIPDQLGSAQIAGLIEGLGLKPHQHKAAEQLSGGNKRRLCLAIALLGNPSLVVIDEASTGVDPENKRFIWGAIRGMANKQRSVMITTHSMEEVEALCARVGIMNKGLMIGFGTVQQLRSRHGEAYTLDVLMKSKKPQKLALKRSKLAKRIIKQFPESVVMEDLERSMQFSLLKKSVPKFSEAMRWLIAKKKKLGIQYFSLYQMSLDQVFVKLVKEYDES